MGLVALQHLRGPEIEPTSPASASRLLSTALPRKSPNLIISFFYMWVSSFPSSTHWRDCLFFFPVYILALFIINTLIQLSKWIYFWALFCAIDLCVCFCASTILLGLLWLCSIVWSQEGWYFQLCSLFSQDFFGNSGSFVVPYKLYDYLFQFCDQSHGYFDRDCIKSINYFG